jgi:penicillin-binding protein 1C
VRMLQSYGVERFHFLLQRLGMRTLNMPPQHYGLSLILGGAESSLWDVCAMYAGQSRVLSEYTLYNSMYRRGDIFRPLLLMNDNHSLPRKGTKQSSDEFEPTGLLDASAIWITYRALLEVNRPEEEAGWKMFANTRRIAWKTGTSYGNRDAWAIGTTPEYTVGVWVGNASGEGRPGLTGVAFAAPIMFDIFNLLPRTSAFEQPYDDMTQVAICRQSGHVAGRFCSETDTAWISLKGLRSMACPWHVPLQLDKSGQYRVNSNCYSVHEMQIQSWFVLPPAMEWFYKTRNATYASLPPWLPGCSDPYSSRPMELIYPSGDVNVMVPRELGGEAGRIVLQAVHQNPDALIFWHLNGEYIGSTRQEHYLAIHPSVGFQHLVLTDENGFSLRQGFRVVANEKRVER